MASQCIIPSGRVYQQYTTIQLYCNVNILCNLLKHIICSPGFPLYLIDLMRTQIECYRDWTACVHRHTLPLTKVRINVDFYRLVSQLNKYGINTTTCEIPGAEAVLGVVHNCHHFHERTQRTLGGGGQGRSYAFLNVVYSDGNEIIAHVQRTSMTKNPLVRNSLPVLKLVT